MSELSGGRAGGPAGGPAEEPAGGPDRGVTLPHYVTTPSGAVYPCTCTVGVDHALRVIDPASITPEMAAAWNRVVEVAGEDRGLASAEFREAWAEWEQAAEGRDG